ncbi:MAG: hypothetical protein P1V51_06565 [Deltaproteobacteria bacterium]|nr:hypothetical protein [Deltaproteobacteria bacterium]
MFQTDPRIGFLDVRREAIVSIIESINHPHIGVPGHEPQATRATVVGLRNPDNSFSIYIALYLETAVANVIYVNDQQRFDVQAYPEVEAEALMFMESMGFMVDNANYRNLSGEQQLELIDRLPCFHADTRAWATRHGLIAEPAPAAAPAMDEDEPDDDILDLSEAAVVGELVIEGVAEEHIPALEPDEVARMARLLASF